MIPTSNVQMMTNKSIFMNSELHTLLQNFQIPSDFVRYENIIDNNVIANLDEWKRNAYHTLSEIRTIIKNLNASSELSLQEQANVVSIAVAFDGNGPWITPASQTVSQGMSVRSLSHNLGLPHNV
jgi:hypothetical protein